MVSIMRLDSNNQGVDATQMLAEQFASGLEQRREREEQLMKQERAKQLYSGIRNAPDKKQALELITHADNKDLFEDIEDYLAVGKEVDRIFEPDGTKKKKEFYKRDSDGRISTTMGFEGEDAPEGYFSQEHLAITRAEDAEDRAIESSKREETRFNERKTRGTEKINKIAVYRRNEDGTLSSQLIEEDTEPPAGWATKEAMDLSRAETAVIDEDDDEPLFEPPDSEISQSAAAYLVNTGRAESVETVDRTQLARATASLQSVEEYKGTFANTFGLKVDPTTGILAVLDEEGSDGNESNRFGVANQFMQELTMEGMPEGRAYRAAVNVARAVHPEAGKTPVTVNKVSAEAVRDPEAEFTKGQVYETPEDGIMVYIGKTKDGEQNWVRLEE